MNKIDTKQKKREELLNSKKILTINSYLLKLETVLGMEVTLYLSMMRIDHPIPLSTSLSVVISNLVR